MINGGQGPCPECGLVQLNQLNTESNGDAIHNEDEYRTT